MLRQIWEVLSWMGCESKVTAVAAVYLGGPALRLSCPQNSSSPFMIQVKEVVVLHYGQLSGLVSYGLAELLSAALSMESQSCKDNSWADDPIYMDRVQLITSGMVFSC